MIEAGMEAILIKVAGIGLTTMHLGKTLDEMRPTLLKLVCSAASMKLEFMVNYVYRTVSMVLTFVGKEVNMRV